VNLVVFLRARLADLTAEQGKALSDLTLAENQRQARPGQDMDEAKVSFADCRNSRPTAIDPDRPHHPCDRVAER